MFYYLPSKNQVQLLKKVIAHTSLHDLRYSEQKRHVKFNRVLLKTALATLQFFTIIGPIKPMNYPVRTVFMLMLGFSSKYTTKQTPNRMFSSLFLCFLFFVAFHIQMVSLMLFLRGDQHAKAFWHVSACCGKPHL